MQPPAAAARRIAGPASRPRYWLPMAPPTSLPGQQMPVALLLLLTASASAVHGATAAHPHILFVLADVSVCDGLRIALLACAAALARRGVAAGLSIREPHPPCRCRWAPLPVAGVGLTCRSLHALQDYGYNDVGYHESKPSPANPGGLPTTSAVAGAPQTPFLDQLASESMRLEMYYVQPLCSPTRATIMVTPVSRCVHWELAPLTSHYWRANGACVACHAQTGRFTSHTGVGPNVIKPSAPYAVPKNETFLPELLKDAGYSTHAVGKVSDVGPSEQGVVQLQCLCVEHEH
eukprot:COSAG01_NODE_9862_length_2318_cov_5.502028_3_plen_291_part_00